MNDENKWISMDDRKPMPGNEYIVLLNEMGDIGRALAHEDSWDIYIYNIPPFVAPLDRVKFWRPLDRMGFEKKPKRTVKMAQAVLRHEFTGHEYNLSASLFSSAEAAEKWHEKAFVSWPLKINGVEQFVEIEVEDE